MRGLTDGQSSAQKLVDQRIRVCMLGGKARVISHVNLWVTHALCTSEAGPDRTLSDRHIIANEQMFGLPGSS